MQNEQCHVCDTTARLIGIAFAGLHLPLVVLGLAYFFGNLTDPAHLVLCALVSTVAAAVLTLGAMWRIVKPQLLDQLARTGHRPHVLSFN